MNPAPCPSRHEPSGRLNPDGASHPSCGRCVAHPVRDGVEAVVFDFDGTVGDTTPGHEQALRAALQEYRITLDSGWYRRHVGLSIHDLLTELPGARGLPHDEVISKSRAHLLATVDSITPIRCVVSLLHNARRAGLPCAIASGASGVLVQPALAALGLAAEFAAIVVREHASRGKPAPDLYAEAARRLAIPPGHCLAVDDAPDGIASARAAGMHVLTLADGHLAPAPTGAAAPRTCPPQHAPHGPSVTDEQAHAPQSHTPQRPEDTAV